MRTDACREKKKNRGAFSPTKCGIGLFVATAFLLVLLRSDIAIEYMKRGLDLCARTVIPSLFPFMVISELMVSSGVGGLLGRLLARPMRVLFGVSENGACAVLLGAICGFPIGTATLCAMADEGRITKEECTRVMTFCNNPGSAFVISAVGGSLFGNRRLGVVLYLCVLLSSATVGLLGRLFFARNQIATSPSPACVVGADMGIATFTRAVRRSAESMLTVCAFVTFFSALVGCVGAVLKSIGTPAWAVATVFGFFEISGGVGAVASLPASAPAILLCALILGWSGLSVHMQLYTLCHGHGINFTPYLIAKATQGLLCSLYTGLAMKCLPGAMDAFATSNTSASPRYSNALFFCCIFFTATVLPILLRAVQKRCKRG